MLAQFVGQHDEAAFRVLMDRYGPMVLRVCKRILGNDLEYGKKLLKKRLTARGGTMTGLMLSLMLSRGSEAAVVPPVLAANTLRTVLLVMSGQQVVAASPAAVHLAGQAIKGLLLTRIRIKGSLPRGAAQQGSPGTGPLV